MLCECYLSVAIPLFTDLPLDWLRPSRQIRAPLFSTKQKRQRRWIVCDVSLLFRNPNTDAALGLQIHSRVYFSDRDTCCFDSPPYVYQREKRDYQTTDTDSSTAALFRDLITINCTVCQNI